MTMQESARPGSPWLMRGGQRPDARLALYCLPHAGGGASAYRDWARNLPAWIDVIAVQLPGRENRIREPLGIDLDAMAKAVEADHQGLPYALFGHSNGALLAFELAHRLGATGAGPVHLSVSGSPPPALAAPRAAVSRFDDAGLVDWMVEQGGVSEQLLAMPDLLELVIPAVRCDLSWLEAYRPAARGALGCPISAFAGETDQRVPGDVLTGWSKETTAGFSARRYPGGHFYLIDGLPALLGDLAEQLSDLRL
ncbi:thioesterase II family protein [Streptomyces sp. TLI_146]|uniref:thioesterase II family protein n=1 Tax=Streptomyces sp. TLI_146 TaxID=1938858 RepID=UPI000C6FFD82|nr:thioesterase domain-containing protein [Streptomyces sp. TLI_146]PKV84114.1 surfactin synthase thioesterase subunit [Streptomyces sp. TLI_146]